jgi:hypothetical protein
MCSIFVKWRIRICNRYRYLWLKVLLPNYHGMVMSDPDQKYCRLVGTRYNFVFLKYGTYGTGTVGTD